MVRRASRIGRRTVSACHSIGPAALLLGLWGLLASCASEPVVIPAGIPPDVEFGPVLELLPDATSNDQVETLIDRAGRAHVIIAAKGTREIHHVIISPGGAVERELIGSGPSPWAVSAAFDAAGRLHVLLDEQHFVQEASGWNAVKSTPWDEAGLRALQPSLVQGPDGLLWAFTVNGKEVGTKGRWEWFAIGGAMGALVFPWHSASLKRVFVPEADAAAPVWYVLDPQDNLDTENVMPAVDAGGNLHVVYDAFRGGIGATYQPRHASVGLLTNVAAADQPAATDTARARQLVPVAGKPIPFLAGLQRTGLLQATSAVDPATGTVLIVPVHEDSVALLRGNWSYPVPLPLSSFWVPRSAPAGGDAFHLVTMANERVWYLHYTDGAWSGPAELGATSFGPGDAWGTLDIASDARRRAFVVWPTRAGIVGRWLDVRSEPAPRASGGDTERPDGTAPVPEHLLDFARGQAKLVTPGVLSGFPESFAAGSNSQLAKELHDAGQWEALATVVLKDDYGDDLRWYFLGRAAEGMALCDTAESYYRVSRERSQNLWTRCWSLACTGFNVQELLDERSAAIAAMRAEGKCRVPPR
jgi:hypothetical protein